MHTTSRTTLSKLAQHAVSLTTYAERDQAFAQSLYLSILHYLDDTTVRTTPEIPFVSVWLQPEDNETATARTAWLLHELQVRPTGETYVPRAILKTWADRYVAPKDIAIGIVGIAIIGPTLGIVKKTKRKKKSLRVVMDQSLLTEPVRTQLAVSHEASTALLADSLLAVEGQAFRLEPDLAEWLFSEQQIKLSTLPSGELYDTLTWLQAEELPVRALHRDGHLVAVAVAPSVRDDLELGNTL